MPNLSFGWIPDSGRLARPELAELLDVTAAPKGSADLRSKSPANQDQNFCGACVGHGTSCGVTAAYNVIGKALFGFDAKGLPVPCSPRDIYAGGRCDDRLAAGQSNTTPLQDVGTEVLSAMQFIADWGVRKTDAPMVATDPSSGQSLGSVNSDCVPANVNNEPTFLELEKDASNLVPKAHQITSTGAQRVTDICLALDAGCPVVFGTYVDTAFLNYTGGIVGKQNQNDPNGGGHCMVLLGYTISGTTVTFIGRNSWGVTWGESGDFRASTAFVAQMSELFAIALVASTGGAA